MQNAHALSLVTTLITLKSMGIPKSLGTGFFYCNDDNVIFLVTNFHVLTGVSPNERSQKSFIGDEIEIKLRDKHGKIYAKIIQLFENGNRLWLEHPTDMEADIALIPLVPELLADADFRCITKKTSISNIQINPSSQVVMIGYPHGYHDSVNNLPIWKTGSLASEPDFDFDGKRLIVVDISAFPGMSGSPALYVSHSGYHTKNGDMMMTVGMQVHFLGVYASMQMLNSDLYLEQVQNSTRYKISHSESLQLGQVWKSALLEEIADSFDANSYPAIKTISIARPLNKTGFITKY